MDDLRAGTEFGDGVGNTIIESNPHSQDHIGVVHCHIGLIKTMHPQHTQKLLIATGVSSEAHQGIGDRVIESLC